MRLLGMVLGLLLASLCLAEVATVRGTVLGPDEKPVAGAEVLAGIIHREYGDPHAANTGADGTFSLTLDVKPEQVPYSIWLLVYAPGFAFGGGTGKPQDQVIVHLQPANTANGLVTDAQGKPVGGVPVALVSGMIKQDDKPGRLYFPPDSTLRERYTTVTGPDGRWTINNMPANGTCNYSITDPRFMRARFEMTFPPKTDKPMTVSLRPGASLLGKVRFADGKPATGVKVFARTLSPMNPTWDDVATDADGSYRIDSLPVGSIVNVMVDEPSGQWVAVAQEGMKLPVGETTLADMVLTAGAVIDITITDEETGGPIGNLIVSSYGPHRPQSTDRSAYIYVRTDTEGRCRLRVAPGTTTVIPTMSSRILRDYLFPTKGVALTLQEGETRLLPIRLKKGLTITGTVVDTEGKPLCDTKVMLWLKPVQAEGDTILRALNTDKTGTFTARTMPPGSWRLALNTTSLNDAENTWELASPQELTLPTDQPVMVVLRKVPLQTK